MNIYSLTIFLLLIMDPFGNLPVFMSILKNLKPKRRFIVLFREMVIALIVMFLFLSLGEHILTFLSLRPDTVALAGGTILLLISIKMIFPEKKDQDESSYENEEPFIIPLAIPLISGPSLLATLILLSHKYAHKLPLLITSIILAWALTFLVFLISNFFLDFLGEKILNALERLMGLILMMLSIQMLLDGVKAYLKL